MAKMVTKVRALRDGLAKAFCERDREVDSLILAALAREHILLLGPPGTAKSELARAFSEALDGATHFEWLMTRFSTPEELFGPVSLSALKADKFTRVTTGKLPEAHVAFLDEVFKANSAVLNALLAVINERTFHNNGHPVRVPLLTCVGASNELPEGPELGALWDRFMLRHWVDYVQSPDSFEAIITGTAQLRSTTRLTLSEWQAAQAEVDAVKVPKAVAEALFQLRTKLAGEGITVSDRRWRKCVHLMRAAAWLDGASEVATEHLVVLTPALWNTPEQSAVVAKHVAEYASKELAAAQRIYDGLVELLAKVPKPEDATFEGRALPARRELGKGVARLREHEGKASAGSAKKIAAMVADLEARSLSLRAEVEKLLQL